MPPVGRRSQPRLVETIGQQLLQGEVLGLPLAVEADDLHLGGELLHYLPAGAAGDAVVLALPSDDDAFEIPMALADGLEDGGAFGTDGETVGGVFNVAAGEHRAVAALQGGAHREMGIGTVGPIQHGDSRGLQFFTGHGKHSFARC